MPEALLALLPDRGVVSVTGPDARDFLDNLITNDMALLDGQEAIHAALLTPQGKILYEFFVVKTPAGFLLETALDQTAALAKRLALYKLRAKIEIKDAPGEVVVSVSFGDVRARPQGAIAFVDPRTELMGDHLLIPAPAVGAFVAQTAARRMPPDFVAARRIALGVPEAGRDYRLGDTFPHEADFDIFHGVSFTKGCYVGQEVVARMQNKTVVRKRVTRVTGAAPLGSGAEVKAGEAVIGSIGSVAGNQALAMLRLDRVVEALDKGQAISAGDIPITVDATMLARYRTSLAEKAAGSL